MKSTIKRRPNFSNYLDNDKSYINKNISATIYYVLYPEKDDLNNNMEMFDNFDDMNTIVKKINFKNVDLKKANIFSVEEKNSAKNTVINIWYEKFSENFNNMFDKKYSNKKQNNTDWIIFIIDSNDKDRFDDTIECFQDILEVDELKKNPILIMENKRDMNGTLSNNEITFFLRNEKYKDRKWWITKTSGINGQGLEENIQWMASTIRAIKEKILIIFQKMKIKKKFE